LPDCGVTLGDRNELTMLGHDIAFFVLKVPLNSKSTIPINNVFSNLSPIKTEH